MKNRFMAELESRSHKNVSKMHENFKVQNMA